MRYKHKWYNDYMTYTRSFFKTGNKYGAVKQTYNNYNYDSKFEARVAASLDQQLKNGEIKSWERQKTIDLYAYGKPICKYRIDFVIEHLDGIREYREAKGFQTDVWRIKWKLFTAQMNELEPSAKLTVIYNS